MKVLIIGLGSIGKKHIEILKKIRPDFKYYALRSSKKAIKWKDVNNLYSWKEIQFHNFYFSIISSPSAFHFKHIKKIIKFKIPVMVEKPLCTSKNQLKLLDKLLINSSINVAFNMRFHPLIIFLKDYLEKLNPIIYEVNTYFGSYLPEWRNKKNKKNYSFFKQLGGGVHLDLIHEPDFLIYLFGMPNKISKNFRKVSNITFDSYDYANINFLYEDFSAQVILNYFRQDNKRILEIVTQETTIELDFIKGVVTDLSKNNIIYKYEGDSMLQSYFYQMKSWLNFLEKKKYSINNLLQSKKLLEKIL